MNPVLKEMVERGITLSPSGEYIQINSQVSRLEGELLQKIISTLKPKICLEVGLAFGVSTLYILEAMKKNHGKKLIGIDPSQLEKHKDTHSLVHGYVWKGIGLNNIRRAGYDSLYKFYNDTSQQVLPKLVSEGQQIDFAFIDGWHTFDHTLIDFFYIDQMLKVGGVIIFDDVDYPSINKVCEFVLKNRNYEIYETLPPHKKNLSKISFLALKKTSDDNRRWDHFVPFYLEIHEYPLKGYRLIKNRMYCYALRVYRLIKTILIKKNEDNAF